MRSKHNNHSMYNYNLKDFLPSSNNNHVKNASFSKINKSLDRRVNTCKEHALSENQTTNFLTSEI
jgi:hypothetical protein